MIRETFRRLWPHNHRLIYRYWNGRRYVWADPLDLWLRLAAADLDWEAAFQEAEQGNRDKIHEIANTLLTIFNAVPFDPATGRGLTLWEVIDLMDGFVRWLDDLKKKTQRWADAVATFGLGALSYARGCGVGRHELWCGLCLHADRVDRRRAWYLLLAIGEAMNFQEPIGREWWNAITETPEQAEALHNLHKARLAVAKSCEVP